MLSEDGCSWEKKELEKETEIYEKAWDKFTNDIHKAKEIKKRREELGGESLHIQLISLVFGVLLTAGVWLLFNFHIVTGANVGFKIIPRDSFGFSEMFVNIDKITGMPNIFARAQYPLGFKALQKAGLIETDDQFEKRIERETELEMKGWRRK